MVIQLIPNSRGHLSRVLGDLTRCGWLIERFPADHSIPRNGMHLVLRAIDREIRLRIFAYKVTSSGRSTPHERRVEITSTFQSGIRPISGFADVVVGVDVTSERYVGIDSRRLQLGGPTHNASSFFDLEGLSVKPGQLLINPRPVSNRVFPGGIEYHAFFDRTRLAEYLFNMREIHMGVYAFAGPFSGRVTPRRAPLGATIRNPIALGNAFVLSSRLRGRRGRVSPSLVDAFQQGDLPQLTLRRLTPDQLRRIQMYCEEIGALGEQAVLSAERKRLRNLGFPDLASKVERVSLKSVGEGYDILSFEDDGRTRRYLEVKATNGISPIVDLSRGEWRAATRHRKHYYIVRVARVLAQPEIFYVNDPVSLESQGVIIRTATGWRVDLTRVLRSGA